ncbi:hypothetical protein HN827_04090 [archaeon]|nr:hypothetical protein [archaeon]
MSQNPNLISNVSLSVACLTDIDRTLTLQKSIKNTLDTYSKEELKNLRLVDLGTGTGILGYTALQQGVGYVSLVDHIKENIFLVEKITNELGFKKIKNKGRNTKLYSRGFEGYTQHLEIHKEDAKKYKPSKEFYNLDKRVFIDLVICELWDTHMRFEDQIPVLKNVKKYTHDNTIYAPEKNELVVTVYDKNNKPLSEDISIGFVDYKNPIENDFSFSGFFKPNLDGLATKFKLSDILYFSDGTIMNGMGYTTPSRFIDIPFGEKELKRNSSFQLLTKFQFNDSRFNGYYLF